VRGAALALRSLCDGHHKKALLIAELRKKNRAFLTAPALAGNKQQADAIPLDESAKRRTKMSRKAAATLAVLLVFGTASAVLADANNQTDYGAFGQHPASMMSNGRTGSVNDAAKLRIVQSAPLHRDGIAGRSRAWTRLTEPGGKLIHIHLEHITAVRSGTQIPGAKAQLDLTSGKFQGVQENVEEVMQQILGTPGARENDEPTEVHVIEPRTSEQLFASRPVRHVYRKLRPFDLTTESLYLSDNGRATMLLIDAAGFAVQVEKST